MMYDKTMFGEGIELGWDSCKFKYEGLEYTAIIQEIHADHLVVKPISRTNWKDIHETGSRFDFDRLNLSINSFNNIELEIWEGGMDGWYAPFHVLFRGDPHKIDTPLFKGVA